MKNTISVCVVLSHESAPQHEIVRVLTRLGAKEVCGGLATLSARFDESTFRKLFDVEPPNDDVGSDLKIPVDLEDKVKSMAVMPRPEANEC